MRHASSVQYGALLSREGALSASEGEGTLQVLLSESGVVKFARHQGFEGQERILMDLFCGILIGRSLQEGRDHGVIRLENLLRDPNDPPVPGLVTPENASSHFLLPLRLIRELFSKSGLSAQNRNTWKDPVPLSWLDLTEEQRFEIASSRLRAGCKALRLQQDVEFVEIKNLTRFVFTYKQDPKFRDLGQAMIELERWLRADLKVPLELQLENIEDRNRSRQS